MKTSTKIIILSVILSLTVILILYFTLKKDDILVKENSIEKKKLKLNITQKKKKQVEVKTDPIINKDEDQIQNEDTQVELKDSDYIIRLALNKCSIHPDISKVLKIDRIIRRFVASIVNISNGESPEKNLDFLKLDDEFKIISKQGLITIDPQSYKRYNYITELFVSFDENKLVGLYRVYGPLLIKAFKELGLSGTTFHKTLIEAINVLLSTPQITGDIYLVEKILSYSFTDEKLELLNNAQKQFLRMGPENMTKVISKLIQIKKLLEN